jgi:hypothetical protein
MHFWGLDTGARKNNLMSQWLEEYSGLCHMMEGDGVRILNISEDTYVPEWSLPRDDWRNWYQPVTYAGVLA